MYAVQPLAEPTTWATRKRDHSPATIGMIAAGGSFTLAFIVMGAAYFIAGVIPGLFYSRASV